MQIVISNGDLDDTYIGKALTVTEVAVPPALPEGTEVVGTVLSLGPPDIRFRNPVPLSLSIGKPTATTPGASTEADSNNTTNSTRRVMGFNNDGTESGGQKIIIHKWVAGINPNNGDPLPSGWMPVSATEQSSTTNSFGETVQTAKCVIQGLAIYAPLISVDYPNMGPKGAQIGPYGQTPSSAGKEIYVGFAAFFVILLLMYAVILLPSWAKEPPPPRPPPTPAAPRLPAPPPPVRPPAALPLSKPMYVQAEPVRFHHGTPIKHFGPTFDDIFDADDNNWWEQQKANADYNFPKLPFDPKTDAQLGYNQ